MKQKILLVEDELIIQEMIVDFFRVKGFDVLCTDNGADALRLLSEQGAELVLLDVMIPGIDGFEVCRQIRGSMDIPVIFLTALETERMQLKGYEVGANDYVTKPFSLPVLMAKVTALIQRKRMIQENREKALVSGPVTILLNRHKVLVNGQECTMAEKEYQLLCFFLEREGQVLTREQILDRIWGADVAVLDRVVDKHIVKLRAGLGSVGELICTVPKVGYVFGGR